MATSETPARDHPVKAARANRGERLVDVATAAGISVSYLSMIEHGYVPNLGIRTRVAAALERPETELWPS
jgi:transcriptional regulator with XRE-family HTH domain